MEKLNKIINDKNKLLVLAGVLHTRKAFIGPEVLHIDLTNRCNFNCIACWCRSPLLGDKIMPEWEGKLILPYDLLKSVIDDVSEMGGLRQVKLVGGGEPFMHPDILRIIEYIKNKDKSIEIDINTNFSLVDNNIAEKLLCLGVDSLTVSLWAGSAEVYSKVHPNQEEETFHKITSVLKFLYKKKNELGLAIPRIIIHNVIFNLNYHDLLEMLEFALDIGADSIQFVPMDPIKGKTDNLLLNYEEREMLATMLLTIKERYNSETFQYISEAGRKVILSDFDGFIRRVQQQDKQSGAYDTNIIEDIPCYAGWVFARIMATGNVVPCCKGHRAWMGNIYKNNFKSIWFSDKYNLFRQNGVKLDKSHPYFSKIGNDAEKKTGCYNCDNLWQNIPIDNQIKMLSSKGVCAVSFIHRLLCNLF